MKKFMCLGIAFLLVSFTVVNAESYYVNNNGLEFTEYQYKVMVDIIGEENVKTMNQKEYNHFNVSEITEDNFEYTTQEYETEERRNSGLVSTQSTYHETGSKILAIARNCGNKYCSVTTSLTWKKNPAVRSYDVIGVRLYNCNFYDSNVTTILSYSNGTKGAAGKKGFSNGVGTAVKLPSSGTIKYISQTVQVKKGTNSKVYGSYQHAAKSVTLSKALNFTISSSGYGGVFKYPFDMIYDEMGGVNVKL